MGEAVPAIQVSQVSLLPAVFARLEAVPGATVPYLLRDISFAVARGDRVAMVGASGSGKTQLLRLLNRLRDPTDGSLTLAGEPYSNIPPIQLRQRVALVPQEAKLLGLTVQETLEYPLELRQLAPKVRRQRVAAWLERLQIPTDWLPRTATQLSVGQRQRVAIARALVTQPEVLLLDEPTAALDLGQTEHLAHVLRELTDTQQLTLLFTTHELELAQTLGDRLFHLHQGTLRHDGPMHAVNWDTVRQELRAAIAAQKDDWE